MPNLRSYYGPTGSGALGKGTATWFKGDLQGPTLIEFTWCYGVGEMTEDDNTLP